MRLGFIALLSGGWPLSYGVHQELCESRIVGFGRHKTNQIRITLNATQRFELPVNFESHHCMCINFGQWHGTRTVWVKFGLHAKVYSFVAHGECPLQWSGALFSKLLDQVKMCDAAVDCK